MNDYSKLQELAEGANAVTGDVHVEMTIASDAGPNQAEIDAVTAFMEAATPSAVLALIAEIRRLSGMLAEWDRSSLGRTTQENYKLKAEAKENEMHMRAFGEVMKSQAGQIEQLKAECADLNADYLKACADFDAMTAQRDRLKAENEALRQFILGFSEYDAEMAYAFAAMSKEGK